MKDSVADQNIFGLSYGVSSDNPEQRQNQALIEEVEKMFEGATHHNGAVN